MALAIEALSGAPHESWTPWSRSCEWVRSILDIASTSSFQILRYRTYVSNLRWCHIKSSMTLMRTVVFEHMDVESQLQEIESPCVENTPKQTHVHTVNAEQGGVTWKWGNLRIFKVEILYQSWQVTPILYWFSRFMALCPPLLLRAFLQRISWKGCLEKFKATMQFLSRSMSDNSDCLSMMWNLRRKWKIKAVTRWLDDAAKGTIIPGKAWWSRSHPQKSADRGSGMGGR